jgi:uncharacterized protein YfdQ (DUF2303 family)
MLNKEAIDALQEGKSIENAFKALLRSNETQHIAVLPSDYQRIDLENVQPHRRRALGNFNTTALASFAAYTLQHAEPGCSVFVDPQAMKATAVLNLGGPDKPGHADNTATLQAEKTAAYTNLLLITMGAKKQAIIAEFLEDWPDLITCFHHGEQLSPPKAIAAIRKITIEGLRKIESEEQQLSASRSAFESVQATSTEKLPTHIYFKCQPYKDLPERTFVLRLQINTGDDKPTISLRMVKAELHAEEMANELAALVVDNFAADIPVMLGQYIKK